MRAGLLLRANWRDARTYDEAETRRGRIAENLAVADRKIAFPILTPENAQAAIDYQDERLAFHKDAIASAEGR